MNIRQVELNKIKIHDAFWSKHVNLVKDVIIPYQWEIMNDRVPGAESSHCIANFKIAAKEETGEFYGAVFQDTDIAKWLEAVGDTLATNPDEKLMKVADEAIDLIAKAQDSNGYLNTYFTIKEPNNRFHNLCEGHELYTAGHFIEAAVAYYEGTGKRKFLDCMIRFADLICETFGEKEGQNHGYPGHQEIELALVKLFRVTGEKKYLDTAKYFIDARGKGKNYFLQLMEQPDYEHIFPEFANYDPKYSQSHLPVREQKTAEGHAVRAVYMYCAMADLAAEYQDESLLDACKTLWNDMVNRRMYITGGIGSSGTLERFTTDYDLPNDINYSESCASIGLALFGLRMARITKEASYIDVVERALYNTVLAGIALDGKSFFYVNPLEVWPDACIDRTCREHVKPVRQKWFGCACCPPNIARTLASLGQYIYSVSEDTLFINLFVSNEAEVNVSGENVKVKMETHFPYENEIKVNVSEVNKKTTFAIRIPDYAKNYTIKKGNTKLTLHDENGFAYVTIDSDCSLSISFEAPATFVRANPRVRADVGKVAIAKGPMVYCLEEVDNGSILSDIYVDTKQPLKEEWVEEFGGSIEITASGKRVRTEEWDPDCLYSEQEVNYDPIEIKAIPYAYWTNRGKGEMTVWLKEWR
ncbi:putative glycosyl hydrolase of unknown function [Lachnospiraceae bacterium KM106-2]|nr:putative glycosyl hydrolase of unknown function [Lachnospiraceae bacterium KM106-2]